MNAALVALTSLERLRMFDNFTAGLKTLEQGGLAKWVRRTTMGRGLFVEVNEEEDVSSDEESESDDEEEPPMTLGLIHAFDGEVVVDVEEADAE